MVSWAWLSFSCSAKSSGSLLKLDAFHSMFALANQTLPINHGAMVSFELVGLYLESCWLPAWLVGLRKRFWDRRSPKDLNLKYTGFVC